MIAAAAILEGGGKYRRKELAEYERRLVERLGPLGQLAAINWVPAAWLRYVGARLLAKRWFSRRVVLDDWFLHRKQAALPA